MGLVEVAGFGGGGDGVGDAVASGGGGAVAECGVWWAEVEGVVDGVAEAAGAAEADLCGAAEWCEDGVCGAECVAGVDGEESPGDGAAGVVGEFGEWVVVWCGLCDGCGDGGAG